MTPVLQTSQLCKQYQMGAVWVDALQNIEFCAQQGEFVAIMGPSGSGKSTLLHLLGGLDTATSGSITLDGQTLSGLDDDALSLLRRRYIGFIFQFFNLVPTLTAAENVALPLMMDGENPTKHTSRIDELLALVRLADRKHHKPTQLSGGQQQRIAVARALVMQPALVLADEPTGNLDSKSSMDILNLLRRACDEHNQTLVMVTHDPRAASFADRIVYLKDGEIVRELADDDGKGDRRSTQTIRAVMTELEL